MKHSTRNAREAGFALVAALIVLVILSSIGAGMLRMTSLQQASASGTILGARANWAAQSGIEWGVYRAQATGGCTSGTLNLTEGALAGFQVTVTCLQSTHREGATVVQSLSIRSQAQFGTLGGSDFVYREVRAAIVL